jgi:hypothetical protein
MPRWIRLARDVQGFHETEQNYTFLSYLRSQPPQIACSPNRWIDACIDERSVAVTRHTTCRSAPRFTAICSHASAPSAGRRTNARTRSTFARITHSSVFRTCAVTNTTNTNTNTTTFIVIVLNSDSGSITSHVSGVKEKVF